MNITLTAGLSEGGECANCFLKIVKGKRCMHLHIKKVRIVGPIAKSHHEEICPLCSMELFDQHGRETGKMRTMVEVE